MKIVVISDTHNRHKRLTGEKRLPAGDLLIHAGDLTGQGLHNEVVDVFKWFRKIAPLYTHGIVFIAGNHDRSFDGPKFGDDDIEEGSRKKPLWLQEALDNLPSNVRYLENN
jgi:predicted phosphodiesterase